MKINFKKLLFISAAIIFSVGLFYSSAAHAATSSLDLGLQPLDATGLGHADIRIIIANIIKSALGLLGILAVSLMLYAGYEWMTSGGNEEQIGTAKKILLNAVIGLAIILSAYSIVAFVMTKLVEATGYNGGVDPKCQIQVNNGGPSCGSDCPPCGDCPPGVDCSVGESFHISQKPSGGDVCVANYYPLMVFNKDVDLESLNHTGSNGHPDNIQVINNLTSGVLDGTWHYQNGNYRQVYFTSPTKCVANGNYYCFEPKTSYKIVVSNSSNIKTKSGTQSLTCSGIYNCSDVNFVTGDKIDSDTGEKFSFPVPVGDCGGECGSCAGDICKQNSDCSSGYCEIAQGQPSGVCINKTKIDYFSLDSGAVGDYVSVFGKYFGQNPGHVYFSTSTGNNWIEATPVNCGANFKYWTDNQIIISVPPSISPSGPIKVVTELGGVNGADTTGDSWGAQSAFTLTTVSHPGICSINPSSGYDGQSFDVGGKGFGKLTDLNLSTDGLFFQDANTKISGWSENLIGSFAPVGLGNGYFTVQAKKNGQFSNGIKFTISGSNPNGPIIIGLSTSSTSRGDYLVIYGKNFGSKVGDVIFNKDADNNNGNISGDFNFPAACKNFTWNDGQIIVKIPDTIELNSDFSVRVKLFDNPANPSFSPLDNNFVIHTVAGPAKPGICSIDPASGPVPFTGSTTLNIYGDNLGNVNAAYFWKVGAKSGVLNTLASAVVTLDTNNHITTQPGAAVISGPFLVTALNDKQSNTAQFSVFDCTKNNNTCANGNEQCCATGNQSGMCIPNTDTCSGTKRSAGYVWLFSTGGISPVPEVVERCNVDTEAGVTIPSPSPSTMWNTNGSVDASNVCQTAVATVEFSTTLDQTTVNASTVKLYTCTSINGNQCVGPVLVDDNLIDPTSYTLKISSNNSNNVSHTYLSIALKNNAKWTANTWYQIILNSGIKSVVSKNKYNQNVQFNLAATKPCGDGTAYCFAFRAGEGDCKLKEVVVTPSQFWTDVLEEPIRYHTVGGDAYDVTYSGNGLSTQRCIMMNVNGFDWTWSPVSTNYVKRLSTFGPSNRLAQFGAEANTVGIGLPNNSVSINAAAATTTNGVVTSKTGTSTLTIDLSNPQVVDYEPKCLEACTGALVSATFNVSMSDKNLSSAVKLYKCNDENCLSTQEIANSAAIDVVPSTGRRWVKIFNNVNGQNLFPNALYKVVLSASSSPDINSGAQLWSLASAGLPASYSKPFSQEFSWRFRTKKEACAIDRVEVSPKIFTAQKLNDRAIFSAQPYSAPDACSLAGQKLNPSIYNWNWASGNLEVATVQTFTSKGRNPYCTNNCLLTGSNISAGSVAVNYPVCGNDVLEAGEDCIAPNAATNCSLNCLNLIKTKKGSQASSNSQDVNASICGNGMLGIDEDCDLGIAPSSTVTSSAMFCGPTCLHSGTPLSSAWCKDHKNDKGGFSADQFNQACAKAFSRCGDGVEDYNEDPGCDIGNGNHANDCNNSCLKLVRCNAGDVGCSADGQKQGSALTYPIPSICGDGVVGAGEDAQCDNEANFVGTIKNLVNPWVLAIGQGGGQPSGVPPVQSSNITGTTNNKSGVGKYQVECGWQTDDECANKYGDPNRGVGDNSCCYARPELTKVYPGSTANVANNICMNTYIEADFDSVIDINTLPGNLLLAKLNDKANVCASGTEMVSNDLIAASTNYQNLAWYQKVWYKVVATVKNIFGNKVAQASVWCAGSDLATPAVVPDGNGGSKIILQLKQALASGTQYAVVLKTGIKDINGVKIRNGANGKPLGWQFVTGQNICEVSSVTVNPDHYNFNTANASTTLTAQAHAENDQLIVSVPGYAWDYSWGPKINNFVTLASTTGSIDTITSQNRNGELDIFTSAHITDNKFTKQTGLVGTGRSRIIVFLCENPWPPLKQKIGNTGPFDIFPYEDKAGNNDNYNITQNIFDNTSIPPSQVVSAGYFNFSTYYCADSGASGSVVDDLPYLKPAVQVASTTLGSGSFVSSTVQMAVKVCANDLNKDCSVDSDCGMAKIVSDGVNTFTASSTKSGICCSGTASNDQFAYFCYQKAGQFLSCDAFTDCQTKFMSDPLVQVWSQNLPNQKPNSGFGCKALTEISDSPISKCISANKDGVQLLAKPFNALKRFFFTNNKNGDAIGVQILSNPNHLSAREWFELDKKSGGQGFVSQAGLQDIHVDGYDAVTDGNNIYVNALNFSPSAPNAGNLYTNTYLFSINANASDETRKVFDQVVKNLKFNLNLTNDKRCVVAGNGPTESSDACNGDFDCPTGQVCSAQKSKLQRDFARLQNMGQIFDALETYGAKHNNTYPDLKAGTYLSGQTISTWPSWSVLGNAVGTSLPLDPVNKLGVGGTCASSTGVFCTTDTDCVAQTPANQKCVLHDPNTGWSTENQRFSFACSPSSLAYRYIATSTSSTVPGANNYKIKLNWEIIGLNNQGLNILNKTNLFNDFIPAGNASKFDLNSNTGICNQTQEISSLNAGTCGDGKVGKDEACDPPGGVKWNLAECNVQGVVSSTILHGDICTNSCQWQSNATSTTCGAKLSKCNNGLVEIGEACDDGALNGKYGHCNNTCSGFTSTCGDGNVDQNNEVCDTKANGYLGWCVSGFRSLSVCSTDADCNLTANSAFASTNGKCETLTLNNNKYAITKIASCNSTCQNYGPYCGDGIVDTQFGEECDGSVGCSLSGVSGNRICGTDCRWKNNLATVYYKFDDVWVSNSASVPAGKSYIPNSASSTGNNLADFKAYCTGDASQGCPATVASTNDAKKLAMSFNGTSNYFVVDSKPNFNVNELTFATWINIDSNAPAGWNPIFTKSNHSDNRNHDHNRDYNFYFYKTPSGTIDTLHMYSSYYADEAHLTTGTPPNVKANDTVILGISGVDPKISAGEWHFIAVTVNAARETRYYVDGKLMNSGNLNGTTFANGNVGIKADHNYPLWIGRGDDDYFKGKLDDFHLYGRALSTGEIQDLYNNSNNLCQLSSAPQEVAVAGNCGNSIVDQGEVCDKGSQNGIVCTSGYNKSCTYCAADCKNVVTVNASGYCGDYILNKNSGEKCEAIPNFFGSGKTILLSSATSSGTGPGGLSTGSFSDQLNGYVVFSCDQEYNITLNSSSSYWYSEFLKGTPNVENNLIGKVGTKSCAVNCGIGSNAPVQDSCVSCGLNDKGVVVSGAIINVLDPTNNNTLMAQSAAEVPGGHLGYIDLLYPQKNSPAPASSNGAYKVAHDSYGSGNGFFSYKLHPTNGSDSTDATIEANPMCSDKNQSRYYRMALNADWSNEHMIDFPVFGITTPDSYNLFLSPVIPQNEVKSTVDTAAARPNDLRVVVSWSGKDSSQFSAGFLSPDFIPAKWVPNTSNVDGFTHYYLNNNDAIW
ncbi:MAG: hypothetical protein NT034_00410, partial [Candidatus Magasanikbacteria bacterium]|nr:hypothetical protein [Candidatus Magasanikbacteria bacterium]